MDDADDAKKAQEQGYGLNYLKKKS